MFTGLILYLLTHHISSAVSAPVPHPIPEGAVAYWGSGNNWPMSRTFLGYPGCNCGFLPTDFNHDGTVTSQDFLDFLTQFYIDAATQGANP